MVPETFMAATTLMLAEGLFSQIGPYAMFFIGLSLVIFVHELGHFLVAKYFDVRVTDFAIGFGSELFGFTRGETRYSIRALPLGGYVKMLGQEDFAVDKEGELVVKDDPRSYSHKPVGQRMGVVSAGVISNVAFAAVFFMIAFMIGMEVMPPKVGIVLPDTPASRAGLRPGDEILSINGSEVTEWADIMMRIMLSDPGEALELRVRHDDEIRTVQVAPEYNQTERLRQIGIGSPQSLTVGYAGWPSEANADGELQVGDEIVALGGKPVKGFGQVAMAIAAAEGQPVELTVKRPTPGGGAKQVTVYRRASVTMLPVEQPNLLGAAPRIRIGDLSPRGAAARAGLQEGDIILEWDGIPNPTWKQISETITRYWQSTQPVRVRRGGRDLDKIFLVKPEKRFTWSGTAKPQVGITYRGEIDEMKPIVARVLADTPMAAAGVVAEARITAVAGQPVSDWFEIIQALKRNNGKTVELAFEVDGELRMGHLHVPRSLSAELHLPPYPGSAIVSVGGVKAVPVKQPDDSVQEYSVNNWQGLKAILGQNVGQDVDVAYLVGDEPHKAQVHVTEDLVDPWYLRVWFVESFGPEPERALMRTTNPVKATWWGIKRTYYFLINAYITIKQMLFTQQIGVEHMSGPVGIIQMGSRIAESGLVQLIYFLAFLSANFAVVNFLPFPIVDGGHFMFLMIEKIKGKPLPVRVQMVTQVIGLAMIFAAFLFLTIQDIILWQTR